MPRRVNDTSMPLRAKLAKHKQCDCNIHTTLRRMTCWAGQAQHGCMLCSSFSSPAPLFKLRLLLTPDIQLGRQLAIILIILSHIV